MQIPKAIPEPDWSDVEIEGGRIGVISDIHVPKHCTRSLGLCVSFLKDAGIDHLLMLGDVTESESLSDHERKKLSESDFARELEVTKEFLFWVRDEFPHIPITWKEGNHDDRIERYSLKYAPALAMLDCLTHEALFGLERLGIRYVKPQNHCVVKTTSDTLTMVHGQEIKLNSGGKNPAQKLLDKTFASAMCAHLHVTDSHYRTDINGKRHQGHVLGCLRNLKPSYVRLHQWNNGFALIDNWGDGYHVENKRIQEGEIY